MTENTCRTFIAACKRRHPASHRFRPVHQPRRQRSSDHVPVGRRDRRDAVLLRDALRPEGSAESRQRSLRAVEGARRADPLRRLGRGRALPARAAAQAAADSTRISRATRRRGCRSSTSRPDRSARASAPRSASRSTRAASGPTTAPTCCSATARWPRARSGKRPTRRCTTSSTTSARSSTSTRSARASRRSSATTLQRSPRRWSAFGWHAIVVDGHDIAALLEGAWTRRARRRGKPTMIVARTLKGKGCRRSKARTAGTARR